MRLLLLLLVPAIWGLMWLIIRVLMSQRAASNMRRERETVIEVNWRDPQDYRPPVEEDGPPCGRHNLHLFMRLFGAERACRHCAEVRKERERYEQEEAIREAERHITPGSSDSGARHT